MFPHNKRNNRRTCLCSAFALTPSREGSLQISGFQASWAMVEFLQGLHYFLSDVLLDALLCALA